MDLESIKNFVQIVFWCGALTLAFLTHRNAKKTLLSPVNTEYQKRIFDSLARISERLFSELKMGDSQHWIRRRPMKEALNEICQEWKNNKESIRQYGLKLTDWPAARDWYDFHSIADEVRYELFLPDSLRNKLIVYLEERAESAQYAHNHAIQKFVEQVNANQSFEDLSVDNFIEIENFYIEGMEEMKMSVDHIYRRNEEIMEEIIKYVRSFDPEKRF